MRVEDDPATTKGKPAGLVSSAELWVMRGHPSNNKLGLTVESCRSRHVGQCPVIRGGGRTTSNRTLTAFVDWAGFLARNPLSTTKVQKTQRREYNHSGSALIEVECEPDDPECPLTWNFWHLAKRPDSAQREKDCGKSWLHENDHLCPGRA